MKQHLGRSFGHLDGLFALQLFGAGMDSFTRIGLIHGTKVSIISWIPPDKSHYLILFKSAGCKNLRLGEFIYRNPGAARPYIYNKV